MKPYWVSWWYYSVFEYNGPWWESGYRENEDGSETGSLCAAVMAESEEAAKAVIVKAHDVPPTEIEWRFCEERPEGWSPAGFRFRMAEWMKWPWPAASSEQ